MCCFQNVHVWSGVFQQDVIISDRQLRPRRQTVTSQRAAEEKNPKESKSLSTRTFRIESDLMFPQDELEFLLDLVRHMHPYCLRTHVEKDTRSRDVHVSSEEEEEVFVDVEGYEEQEENVPELSGKDSEENNVTSMHTDIKMPQRSALVKKSDTSRTKKRVSFAVHLTLVYEIPPNEPDADSPGCSASEDGVDECCTFKSEQTCDVTSPQKPKSLSLQQYRLLRQNKQLPLDERTMDHRTKWPSLPHIPRELAPILPEFNLKTPSDEKIPERSSSRSDEVRRSSCRNASKVKSGERRFANICVDPPNPTIVTLKPTQDKPESTPSEVQTQPVDLKPQTHPETSEVLNSDSLTSDDAGLPEHRPTMITSGPIQPTIPSPCSPQTVEPVASEQTRPTEGQHIQTTAGEIGKMVIFINITCHFCQRVFLRCVVFFRNRSHRLDQPSGAV